MKCLFMLAIALGMASSSYAQDSTLKARYEQFTIYQHGAKYLLDGQRISRAQLDKRLALFPESANLSRLSSRNNATGGLLMLGTLASYLTAGLLADKQPALAWGFLGLGFSANIVAIPFTQKSQKQLQKAVWLYNRDVLVNGNRRIR